MKLFVRVANISFLIVLFLLLAGLVTSETYNTVFFIAPIFFKEIFIVCIFILFYVGVYITIKNSYVNHSLEFLLLFLFSLISFRMAYLNHPVVKKDILFERMIDYSFNEDEYNEKKAIYESHNAIESFELLDMESKMFRAIYELQFNYLKNRNKLNNPNYDAQFLFFIISGIALLVNCIFLFFNIEESRIEKREY